MHPRPLQISYEAYGAGGTGFICECLTDNINRSAFEVRTAVTKGGGKMAEVGERQGGDSALGMHSHVVHGGGHASALHSGRPAAQSPGTAGMTSGICSLVGAAGGSSAAATGAVRGSRRS